MKNSDIVKNYTSSVYAVQKNKINGTPSSTASAQAPMSTPLSRINNLNSAKLFSNLLSSNSKASKKDQFNPIMYYSFNIS